MRGYEGPRQSQGAFLVDFVTGVLTCLAIRRDGAVDRPAPTGPVPVEWMFGHYRRARKRPAPAGPVSVER